MSFIVAVAYEEILVPGPPIETWQELRLATPVPAQVASAVLPQFQRWRRYAEPVLSSNGDVVGIRVSSRMSKKLAQRLRAKIEPFLAMAAGETASPEPVPTAPDGRRIVSLSKFGLHIPSRTLMRARTMLERIADIEVQYDSDEENVVALLIPAGAPIPPIYNVLEVDTVPIDPKSSKQPLLGLLLEELKRALQRSPGHP